MIKKIFTLIDLLMCCCTPDIKTNDPEGGAVAEWSKALLVKENKRKSKRFAPRPGHLLEKKDI